jgi:hypothetical protein
MDQPLGPGPGSSGLLPQGRGSKFNPVKWPNATIVVFDDIERVDRPRNLHAPGVQRIHASFRNVRIIGVADRDVRNETSVKCGSMSWKYRGSFSLRYS